MIVALTLDVKQHSVCCITGPLLEITNYTVNQEWLLNFLHLYFQRDGKDSDLIMNILHSKHVQSTNHF